MGTIEHVPMLTIVPRETDSYCDTDTEIEEQRNRDKLKRNKQKLGRSREKRNILERKRNKKKAPNRGRLTKYSRSFLAMMRLLLEA